MSICQTKGSGYSRNGPRYQILCVRGVPHTGTYIARNSSSHVEKPRGSIVGVVTRHCTAHEDY